MELTLPAELQAKLTTRMAHERGTDPQALAREAIERLVDYDDWFLREVDKGLAEVERGQTLSHEKVGARVEKRRGSSRLADAASLDPTEGPDRNGIIAA